MMVSTKLDKKEAAESMAVCGLSDPKDAPLYPYGLSLCVEQDLLLKLGLSELPPVGTVFMLTAAVEVTGVRSSQRQGEQDSSMDLQITDMELGASGRADGDRAKKLYPDQE